VAAPETNRAHVGNAATESAALDRRELGESRTSCLEWQNTAECPEIPGNDGGSLQKEIVGRSGFDPAVEGEQAKLCPTAQGGWIGRTRKIMAVGDCLFEGCAGGKLFTGQLPTTQGENRRWSKPTRQDRKRFPTTWANSPSHPDRSVPIIVALPTAPAMADDRILQAKRAAPRQQS
jgi:hypothetical protein